MTGTSSDPLLADIRARDRERYLSILWAAKAARPALIAIHALDLELLRVVASAREPMLAEIRLAWWREQLEKMAAGEEPPPQPLLQGLSAYALPRGVDLAALAEVEEGFRPLLQEGPLKIPEVARARGAPLFRALLQACTGAANADALQSAAQAGWRWALAQLWRGGFGQAERLLERAIPPSLPEAPHTRLPPPLAALDALAADDWARMQADKALRREASPMRQWLMLKASFRS